MFSKESAYVRALRDEAKALRKTLDDDADAAAEQARQARQAERTMRADDKRVRSYNVPDHELIAADGHATRLEDHARSLRSRQADARRRLNEIEALLNAPETIRVSIAQLQRLRGEWQAAGEKATRMEGLVVELDAEIAATTQRRKAALEQHAEEEVRARLDGKVPAAPKAIATIDQEIEAKVATKATAAAMAEAARADQPRLKVEIEAAEGQLKHAQLCAARAVWAEATVDLAPAAARLVAASQAVAYGAPDVAEVRPSPEAIAAARTALRSEGEPTHIAAVSSKATAADRSAAA